MPIRMEANKVTLSTTQWHRPSDTIHPNWPQGQSVFKFEGRCRFCESTVLLRPKACAPLSVNLNRGTKYHTSATICRTCCTQCSVPSPPGMASHVPGALHGCASQ